MTDIMILDSVISAVDNNTRKPEQFLSLQDAIAADFKNCIKRLYDYTKEQSNGNTNALPELITDGFDEEQIWQQLELQNEGELQRFINGVSKVLATNKVFTLPIVTTKPELLQNENYIQKDETVSIDDDEEHEDKPKLRSNLKKTSAKSKRDKRKIKSIVDDKFFKLSELDEYLNKEEKKEKQSDEDKSDDESLDLFNDLSENEDENTENSKYVKYADFFDNPNSDEEGGDGSKETIISNENDNMNSSENADLSDDNEMEISDNKDNSESTGRKVKFNLTNDSDETDSLENKTDTQLKDIERKSSLEKRQERLQQRIKELEEEAVSEKPWQLKGEVNAAHRPQNSLLEEYVEFDITTRPPPVITEQTTLKLEDIIKQRIKDKAWDDVEKKFKPVETPIEYKKKLILNQEKSKESLSQIYENEYLKQKQALNPESQEQENEEPKVHKEIREAMQTLFSQLDALSNFHYTPKLAKPDIKIVTNVPAINMEEVAPVGTSDAALLAPEEVKAKSRGDVMSKAERTGTDMKRERRQKKLRQRERRKDLEKKQKLNALKPVINKKHKKNMNIELMKRLSKDRNISTADETSHAVTKSSTVFFNQLQQQVKSHIKSKVNSLDKGKKQKNSKSAVKLKL